MAFDFGAGLATEQLCRLARHPALWARIVQRAAGPVQFGADGKRVKVASLAGLVMRRFRRGVAQGRGLAEHLPITSIELCADQALAVHASAAGPLAWVSPERFHRAEVRDAAATTDLRARAAAKLGALIAVGRRADDLTARLAGYCSYKGAIDTLCKGGYARRHVLRAGASDGTFDLAWRCSLPDGIESVTRLKSRARPAGRIRGIDMRTSPAVSFRS